MQVDSSIIFHSLIIMTLDFVVGCKIPKQQEGYDDILSQNTSRRYGTHLCTWILFSPIVSQIPEVSTFLNKDLDVLLMLVSDMHDTCDPVMTV